MPCQKTLFSAVQELCKVKGNLCDSAAENVRVKAPETHFEIIRVYTIQLHLDQCNVIDELQLRPVPIELECVQTDEETKKARLKANKAQGN
jgi:hypothetical protein